MARNLTVARKAAVQPMTIERLHELTREATARAITFLDGVVADAAQDLDYRLRAATTIVACGHSAAPKLTALDVRHTASIRPATDEELLARMRDERAAPQVLEGELVQVDGESE